jgi:hypothetical protein
MNIEEAVKHCKEKEKECEGQCGEDHAKLSEWLEELIELRKKNAVPEENSMKLEYLTVGMIKKLVADLPSDTKIYYERIEDIYFEENGWKATPLKSDAWWDRAGFDVIDDGKPTKDETGEWIEAYEAFYNEEEGALKITAHY